MEDRDIHIQRCRNPQISQFIEQLTEALTILRLFMVFLVPNQTNSEIVH